MRGWGALARWAPFFDDGGNSPSPWNGAPNGTYDNYGGLWATPSKTPGAPNVRGPHVVTMSSVETSNADSTADLTAALAACKAIITAGSAKAQLVLDSRRKYVVGGSLVQGANGEYAQVPLPFSKTVSGTIEVLGMEGAPSPYVGLGQSATVIESTLTGPPAFTFAGSGAGYGVASTFGGPSSFVHPFRAFGNFNYLWYSFKNLAIRSAAPCIVGIDAGYLNGFYADGLRFDTDQTANFPGGAAFTSSGLTIVTALQAIPVILPLYQCYFGSRIGSLQVLNWATGPVIGELANIDDLLVNFVPAAAINLDVSAHQSHIKLFRDWNNAYGVGAYYPQATFGLQSPGTTGNASQGTFTGAAPSQLKIGTWDFQDDDGGTNASLARVYDLYDGNGIVPIDAEWSHSNFSAGNPRVIGGLKIFGAGSSATGAVQSRIRDFNALPGLLASPPSVPASGVATRNPIARQAIYNVVGGTVSAISVNGQATAQTGGFIPLAPNDVITLTYSVAPTWKVYAQ